MATLHESGTQTPSGPNNSQASGTELHMERSSRFHVIRRPRLKMFSDDILANSQSQLEYTPASNNVAFKYSAGTSAVSVSTSTTNTARQKAQAARIYGRNAASWLHYLDRKIKVTISKLDSINHDIESGINLFSSKMSSNVCKIDNKIQLIIAYNNERADVVKELHQLEDIRDSHYYNFHKRKNILKKLCDDTVRKIECLSANKDNCNLMISRLMKAWKADTGLDMPELDRQIRNLTIRKDQYDRDVNKKIEMLSAKQETCARHLEIVLNAKVSYANYLDKQIKLLSAERSSLSTDILGQLKLLVARKSSYTLDFKSSFKLFSQQVTSSGHDIRRQSELVDSMKAPFSHVLERQLKLLDAKLALFCDLKKQQALLNSKMFPYVMDMAEKVQELHFSLISHFREDRWPSE